MEIGSVIGQNLKRYREERNMSLGQLAEKAGLSKVVLLQIERGGSNPTVNTIWKITGALELPYSCLLEKPAEPEMVKKEEAIESGEDGFHIFSYYQRNPSGKFEIYRVELEPGCMHYFDGNGPKTSEYVLITEGEVIIDVDGKRYILGEDDALNFDASVPHCYHNMTNQTVKMTSLRYYA